MDPLKGLSPQEKKDIIQRIALEAGWARNAPDDVKQGVMHAIAEARGGAYLSQSWPGTRGKALWRCQNGDEWEAISANVMYMGTWCRICAGRNKRRLPPTPARLRERHNSAAIKSRARHRLQAFGALFEQVSGSLGLVQGDREEATRIFDAIVESGVVRGRSLRVFSAVAILLSAKKHGRSLSFVRMAEMVGTTRKALFHAYQMTRELLGAETEDFRSIRSPATLVPRLSTDLGLPEALCSAAVGLIDRATAEGYDATGKSPSGIAAAAIYLTYKAQRGVRIKEPQKTIARAAGISLLPIRNRARELKKYLI